MPAHCQPQLVTKPQKNGDNRRLKRWHSGNQTWLAGKSIKKIVRLSDLGSGGSPAACENMLVMGSCPFNNHHGRFLAAGFQNLSLRRGTASDARCFWRNWMNWVPTSCTCINELYLHHVKQVEFTQGTPRLMEPPAPIPTVRNPFRMASVSRNRGPIIAAP